MMDLRGIIAHALADGSYDYEKTGKPQAYHYSMAERVIARLTKLAGDNNLSLEFIIAQAEINNGKH